MRVKDRKDTILDLESWVDFGKREFHIVCVCKI